VEKREYLNKFCSEEELKKVLLIKAQKKAVENALNPKFLPDNMSDEKCLNYLRSAIELKAELKIMDRANWQKLQTKYSLAKYITLDTDTREFFARIQI